MPRPPRISIPNIPYHVTQRGNHGIDVFYTPEDRKQYLKNMGQYSSRYKFDIQAYCLMSNHIHLVGIPRNPDSIAKTIQSVQVLHTKAINRKRGWYGNLWQQKYVAIPLDDRHTWIAIRYVEQNPVRAGIVKRAEDYLWSSASGHCGLSDDPLLNHDKRILTIFDNWIEAVNQIPDPEALVMLRERTKRCIPCGDEKFMKKISKKTGNTYIMRSKGRPRKSDK